VTDRHLSRRAALRFGLAGATVAALGATRLSGASALAPLVNPYSGALPMTFPLESGTYLAPRDNWHDFRDGAPFDWSHRKGRSRLHDGVDVFPADASNLPPVFAPFSGIVVATAVDGIYSKSDGGPPQRYPADGVYGHFAWIRSTETASAGYFFFACHLQSEGTLGALTPGDLVTRATPIGVMGESGNATGEPQLHAELHYPRGANFRCTRCKPKTRLTAMSPFASLSGAQTRP